jgi:hypothetical protein
MDVGGKLSSAVAQSVQRLLEEAGGSWVQYSSLGRANDSLLHIAQTCSRLHSTHPMDTGRSFRKLGAVHPLLLTLSWCTA